MRAGTDTLLPAEQRVAAAKQATEEDLPPLLEGRRPAVAHGVGEAIFAGAQA
jgi:hypothetical protein